MTQIPAFLNDEYMPLDACRISPLDRGFIFGDGVYELIPVYRRKAFRLQQHLLRLARSIEQVQIRNPYTYAQWDGLVENLISQSSSTELAVYIQVTRGVAARNHVFPEDTSPTVFAMANPLPGITDEQLHKGIALRTTEDMRWQRCDIKVTGLMPNVMAKQEALQDGAAEAILVRNGPGITRDFVLELLDELSLKYHEQAIPESWLYVADELWITSSAQEVLSSTTINQRAVGDGVPGKLWKDVYALYQQRKVEG